MDRFKKVQDHKGFKIGNTIHIKRWYYGEDTIEFNKLDNITMVDVKSPITKITIDETTGRDTIFVKANCSTSSTDIANKGIIN